MIVHKLTPGLQYMPGHAGRAWQTLKVVAHVLWRLVSAYLMPMQTASGGEKTFQVGSFKTAQG